jgi:dTDP-4-amino-4,6-dideoxygalactose transaminase
MIPIARPQLGQAEEEAVLAVLRSGKLAQGEQVQAFERAFANYCGAGHAVATSSGTAALHLTLLAHGIGAGDEVITSPFSFIATANAVLYVGARPVLADIEPETFTLDPEQVEAAITPKTKAIIAVHLFGHPSDIDSLLDICQRHNIALIEDACQAHGAEWAGRRVGTFGTGCFSFYPTKNMTTAEGGMVTTNDSSLAERLRLLRNHGMRQRYVHEDLGFNLRLTDLQAAIGLVQLSKLEAFNTTRIRNASFLSNNLGVIVSCPVVKANARHVFNQYTIRIPGGRAGLLPALQEMGVESAIYYPTPIHKQQPYLRLGYGEGTHPMAERACAEVISLPVHPGLRWPDDLNQTVEAVRSCVKRLK